MRHLRIAYGQRVSGGLRGHLSTPGTRVIGFDPVGESRWSDIGLQALKAVHPLHVPLDGGLARDRLGALGKEPSSLSVAQSLALKPT